MKDGENPCRIEKKVKISSVEAVWRRYSAGRIFLDGQCCKGIGLCFWARIYRGLG